MLYISGFYRYLFSHLFELAVALYDVLRRVPGLRDRSTHHLTWSLGVAVAHMAHWGPDRSADRRTNWSADRGADRSVCRRDLMYG